MKSAFLIVRLEIFFFCPKWFNTFPSLVFSLEWELDSARGQSANWRNQLQEKTLKKHMYSVALSLTAAAVLTACGGGDGGTDIGSKVVRVSIDEPVGVLEAGRLITVKGTASSSSGKLSEMKWISSGAGASDSGLTLTNADCADRQESNSTFANGASNWNCTLTFLAPKKLLAATTYELGLSATSASFAGTSSRSVTIKPASKEPDQVQISIDPTNEAINMTRVNRAGDAIVVSGTVASLNSRVTGAQWKIQYTGDANETNATALAPALTNANCADYTTNYHPAGQEAETWTCAVKVVVPPRLAKNTNYTLLLSGTNANGNTVTGSKSLPVQTAVTSENKVSVVLKPVAAAELGRPLQAGDKISMDAVVTTVNSELAKDAKGVYKAIFGISAINGINPVVGPNSDGQTPIYDAAGNVISATELAAYTFSTICREPEVTPIDSKHTYACVGQLTIPSVSREVKNITYFLNASNDEGFSNSASQTIKVDIKPEDASAFGLRANVGYSPVTIVGGKDVSLTCKVVDPVAGVKYTYGWRVSDSKGYMVNLAGGVTTTGDSSLIAPIITGDPTDPTKVTTTDIVVDCGVSANGNTATWFPLTLKVPPTTTSNPLTVAAPTATVNPVVAGNPTALTCLASGGTPTTAGQYTYTWSVASNPSNVGVALSSTLFTGASSTITATTTTAAAGTVNVLCTANDGNGHTASNTINVVVSAAPTAPTPTPTLAINTLTATVNPVVVGNSTSLTCLAAGGAPATSGQYTYTWSVASNPNNVKVALSGSTFTGTNSTVTMATDALVISPAVPATGTVGILCSANDGNGHTASNTLNIVVSPQPTTPTTPTTLTVAVPTATVNPVAPGDSTTSTCRASGGSPTTAGQYTYTWSVTSNPNNVPVEFSSSTSTGTVSTTTIGNNTGGVISPSVPVTGTVGILCTANDGNGHTASNSFNMVVSSTTPTTPTALTVAVPTATTNPVSVGNSTALTCLATGGTPATSGQYTYTWSIESNPNNVPVSLSSSTSTGATSTTTFTAESTIVISPSVPVTGTVRVLCSANDGSGHVASNVVDVRVQ